MAATLMKNSIEGRIKNTDYYREAMKILRAHHGAKQILGEPIKDMRIDLTDQDIKCDNFKAFVRVKVGGPNEKGIMHFWAGRTDSKDPWSVQRIELELVNQPDKRLLVKKEEKAE